jgi:hypothetical protein
VVVRKLEKFEPVTRGHIRAVTAREKGSGLEGELAALRSRRWWRRLTEHVRRHGSRTKSVGLPRKRDTAITLCEQRQSFLREARARTATMA